MSTDLIEQPTGNNLEIPWTAAFAADVAIAQKGYKAICEQHGVTALEWSRLSQDNEFKSAVDAIRLMLRREGGSFKVKSKALAERVLAQFEAMIYSEETPHTVRADLMKSIVKFSGFDASADQAKAAQTAPFSININLK